MAKAIGLTIMKLRALKPRDDGKPYEVRDEALTGGYVTVRSSGTLSYVVRYRIAGVSKKLTVGAFDPDAGGLAKVRALARSAQNDLHDARRGVGSDPARAKQEQRRAKEQAAEAARRAELAARENTVEAVCAEYLASFAVTKLRPTTRRERARQIAKELAPWRDRPIASISKREVLRLLDGIAATRPVMGNRVHATLAHIFNWAEEREYLVSSPMKGVRRPLEKETARERVLDDAELAIVWRAAGTLDAPWSQFFRLAILTGARKSELAQATWAEFDLDNTGVWSLPGARTKNAQSLKRPLSPMAIALIRSLPKIVGNPHVFGSGMTATQRAKRRLDRAILDVNGGRPLPGGDFVTHDLRRSYATGLQRLGVKLEVTERLLGHTGESQSGIRKVYQRHSFAAEMAEAARLWADHVTEITGEPAPVVESGNVVPFGGRRA